MPSLKVHGHPHQGAKGVDSICTFHHKLKDYIFTFFLISKSDYPQHLPSLICLCFSIVFQILAIACKVLETNTSLFYFLSSLSFSLSLAKLRYFKGHFCVFFFPSNASSGSPLTIKSLLKGGFLFCFVLLCLLFLLRQQKLLQSKMNKDSSDSSLGWSLFSLICQILISVTGISSGRMISSSISVHCLSSENVTQRWERGDCILQLLAAHPGEGEIIHTTEGT